MRKGRVMQENDTDSKNWIKIKLMEANLTQKDLAEKVNFCPSLLSRVFKGKRPIKVEVAAAIAEVLNVETEDLLRVHSIAVDEERRRAILSLNYNDSSIQEDPDGIDQHQAGAKLDSHKPKVDLMLSGFSRALLAVAEVTTYGATKYSINGWQEVKDPIARYSQAKARHMMQGYTETYDQESSLHHAAHEAWNALAVLEFIIRGEEDEKTR